MKIPLQKWREREYPLTAKATIHLWVTQGFFKGKGILANKVTRIGGRWYIDIDTPEKSVADEIIEKIMKLKQQK
jgi:hypothetical protein